MVHLAELVPLETDLAGCLYGCAARNLRRDTLGLIVLLLLFHHAAVAHWRGAILVLHDFGAEVINDLLNLLTGKTFLCASQILGSTALTGRIWCRSTIALEFLEKIYAQTETSLGKMRLRTK